MRPSRCISAALLLAAAVAASAQPAPGDGPAGDDFDSKPWERVETLLPPYPAARNLVRVYMGPTASFEFYVDISSLRVAPDGTIRYTLVARSPSAAMNVSYEGIRCDSFEHRAYAFGRYDGTWAQARNSRWTRISRGLAGNPQAVLADDFFCPQGQRIRTADEAARALMRGNGPGAGR